MRRNLVSKSPSLGKEKAHFFALPKKDKTNLKKQISSKKTFKVETFGKLKYHCAFFQMCHLTCTNFKSQSTLELLNKIELMCWTDLRQKLGQASSVK
jgi:hypothetical protein